MAEPFLQSFALEGRNFLTAGKASTAIKGILEELGINATIIRRVAIATYEAEMNVVMYAVRAVMTLEVTPRGIHIIVEDSGPGIPDIDLAMKEGYSTATPEMREMGFGAGLGLSNIKRNADTMSIRSTIGVGTTVEFAVNLN